MSSRHSSSKKSKRQEWSAWGPWVWSSTYNRYYRQRQDLSGNLETMWGSQHSAATTTDAADHPRYPSAGTYGEGNEEELEITEGMGQVSIDDAGGDDDEDEEDAEYSHKQSSSYTSSRDRYGKGKSSSGKISGKASSKTTASTKTKKSSTSTSASASGKGKYPEYEAEAIEEQDEEEQAAYYPADGREANQSPTYGVEPSIYPTYGYTGEPTSGARHQGYATGGRYSASSRGYQQTYDEPEEVDEQYDQAIRESRQQHQQHQQNYRGGESSRNQSSRHKYPQATASDEVSEGNRMPTVGQFDISGNEGEYEDLDPRYRVEPSHKFQPGEVFKVLWPEPTGQSAAGTPTISDRQKIPDRYGGTFYVGFRRFVVIANDAGHCTCVPILTYGGKGCKKKGIKPEKHGIVTEIRHRAKPLEGEPKLGFPSVRLVIEVDGERLAKESRINYSKLVTVEHNVKVFFIGHIYPDDYQLVADAVNICWEDKIHQRKKHTR